MPYASGGPTPDGKYHVFFSSFLGDISLRLILNWFFWGTLNVSLILQPISQIQGTCQTKWRLQRKEEMVSWWWFISACFVGRCTLGGKKKDQGSKVNTTCWVPKLIGRDLLLLQNNHDLPALQPFTSSSSSLSWSSLRLS